MPGLCQKVRKKFGEYRFELGIRPQYAEKGAKQPILKPLFKVPHSSFRISSQYSVSGLCVGVVFRNIHATIRFVKFLGNLKTGFRLFFCVDQYGLSEAINR